MLRPISLLLLAGCGVPAGPEPPAPGLGGAASPAPDASNAPTEPDYRRGPQAATATSLGHLCQDAESVAFTCTLQGGVGMVSVCGVKASDAAWDLTARFASQDSPAVAIPSPLRYARDEGTTTTRTLLGFARDGTAWEIQTSYEHDTSCYQVFVLAPDGSDQTMPCTGPVFDQLGGLVGQGLTIEPYWR